MLSLTGVALPIIGPLLPHARRHFQVFDPLKRPELQPIMNAYFSVDSFFFIGGFLVSYGILKKLEAMQIESTKDFFKRFPLMLAYLLRWARLTPLYAVMIGISATLPPYLGSGPFYQARLGPGSPIVSHCVDKWWTNMLYINIFFVDGDCVGQSWYMADDYIFFILAPCFIVPLHLAERSLLKNRGLWWTAFVAAVLSIATAAQTYKEGIRAQPLATVIDPSTAPKFALEDPAAYSTITSAYYFMPWCRMQPYLVGIAFAFMMQKDLLPRRIAAKWLAVGYVTMSVLAYVMVYGLRGENNIDCTKDNVLGSYDPDECTGLGARPSMSGDAMYNGFARGIWAVILALLTYFCHYGYGGPINWFLSSGAWLPLARISFAAYLVHFLAIEVYYFSKPAAERLSVEQIWYDYISNLVMTYFYAFLLVVFVEFPAGQLVKLATTKKTPSGR